MFRFAIATISGLFVWAGAALANPEQWKREGWRTDFSKTSIELTEIRSGGPPRDGIPSIDDPKFMRVSEEKTIGLREPVIRLEINDDVRAYPLRILIWHEIVNDVVGGRPVAVTYCPLCNASITFDRLVDGKVLEFGTTGKLRHSDLVMYDRQTDSWWQQFTGDAIAGEMTGKSLKLIPSRVMSFDEYRKSHPEGRVLVPNNPEMRAYGRNPYSGYDSAAMPFLYDGDMPDGIAPMARVVIIRTDKMPLIVDMSKVVKKPFEKDGYRISWQEGVASALDDETISEGRDVGTIIVTKDGKEVVHDVTFAFVAHAFHPEAPIIGN